MKFTDKSIESLKKTGTRYIAWKDNGNGFGVRVSANGKKTFIYMYRFEGRSRMMTLGNYPAVKLADANRLHADAISSLDKNIDPGATKQTKKIEDIQAYTIESLVDEYIEKWAKPRKRSWARDKAILEKDVVHRWKKRKAKSITRRDIIGLLDAIVDRDSPIQANRIFEIIRKMFNFAVSRDIVEFNPCLGVKAPSKENRRDRMLNEKELVKFWTDLDITKMHHLTKLAFKMILLTGQRPGEVLGMEWQDIELDTKWWTIPAIKAKNELSHRVPLSPQALALIEELKQYSSQYSFLFPSPRSPTISGENADTAGKHINVSALSHAILRNTETFKINPFTSHDLRRTAASHMTSMGIARLVVKKILNHVESDITAVYDRHSYDQEKRHALDAWGNHLNQTLNKEASSNVVVTLPIKG